MQEIAFDTADRNKMMERAALLFGEQQDRLHCRTDRLFAWLLGIQWLAGIAAALVISPRTWAGSSSQTHWHVWAAIFLGGAIAGFPIFLTRTLPGHSLTRHAIAVAQMLTSALFIHLTGGRIETHFHVFGSLAFLACYRDWRVLATATVVVATDHLTRALFWPQSVFGVLSASPWRVMEHAGWVIFEDVFLLIAIRQSLGETLAVAKRQAELEAVNQGIERLVQERTRELQAMHQELIDASRKAGMAEVATGVIHNVGNVLNSVNVSASVVSDLLGKSRVPKLGVAVKLLTDHASDLADYLGKENHGSNLTAFLAQLANHLNGENRAMAEEMQALAHNLEHIKEIVNTQQEYAGSAGLIQSFDIRQLLEDALRIHAGALAHLDVVVVREFADVPPVQTDKHKLLQILVNLISNARHAMAERPVKKLTLKVEARNGGGIRISVADTGCGIAAENMTRIFAHGFTTRKDGHGFGLHSSALAAKEMKGSLDAHSDGLGHGAVFTIELPPVVREALAA